MASRAPPAVETEPSGDVLRTYANVTEPMALQIRRLEREGDVKLIWWFVAAVDEDKGPDEDFPGEAEFEVEFCGYRAALEKLTFQLDRDLMGRAIGLVEASCS